MKHKTIILSLMLIAILAGAFLAYTHFSNNTPEYTDPDTDEVTAKMIPVGPVSARLSAISARAR